MRVGNGFDAHRFGGIGPLKLGGVVVSTRGLEGTSDADVLTHAVCDALLGGAALGDVGSHFPASDDRWHGADSIDLLTQVVGLLRRAGLRPTHVDATVIAQTVRVAPHRSEIQTRLAATLGLETNAVSIKATTTDHMGFLGRDEGIAAVATAVLTEI